LLFQPTPENFLFIYSDNSKHYKSVGAYIVTLKWYVEK
jgi:hypothetical protein